MIKESKEIFGSYIQPTIVENLVLRSLKVDGVASSGTEIKVDRNTLQIKTRYLGVLIHEHAHIFSKAGDCTREFESCLTSFLGQLAWKFEAETTIPSKQTLKQEIDKPYENKETLVIGNDHDEMKQLSPFPFKSEQNQGSQLAFPISRLRSPVSINILSTCVALQSLQHVLIHSGS